MLWALLAAFLRRRPPWLQAGTVGLCTGIFMAANVNTGPRNLRLHLPAALVLTAAVPIDWAFSHALRAGLRSRAPSRPAARLWSMLHTLPCG